MQDCFGDFLHLGDFAFPEDASTEHLDLCVKDQRLLAEEDRILLNQLPPGEVQEWCLLRITEHQNHIQALREVYGAAARDAISTTKSHIRALRSTYNDAALINEYLPSEVLMEVFSHVHPAVMPRPRVPVLRVCRYWRRLLLRTPQFWANILSLPTWKSWNPRYRIGRFRAAIVRSAPWSLELSVPYCDKGIADTLAPHTSRLSSLKVGPTLHCVKDVAQLLEQYMPRLTHLAILQYSWYNSHSTFTLNFPRYPNINIQAVELERTYIYTPVSPHPSLCHLKLKHCAIRHSPTTDRVPALRAVHNALELFPNLETLSITHSLSDDDPRGRRGPPPELRKIVHLPRLRLLELEDIPAYIPPFLSHLVFPLTTSLVLEPAYRRDFPQGPTPVPLFPGINPSPAPHASLSLYLDFRGWNEGRARWETHGEGVRPVCVTLVGAASHAPIVTARFTRELGDALAPALGVTSLTVEGTMSYRGYWDLLLSALPGLRRLTYEAGWAETKQVADLLGKRMASGGFACPRLEHLGLVWHIPTCVDGGSEDEWRPLRDSDGGGLGGQDSELSASLRAFCDTLAACLVERGGTCERIKTLSVAPRQWRFDGTGIVFQGLQMALAEQRLRDRLGDLVEDITVVDDLD